MAEVAIPMPKKPQPPDRRDEECTYGSVKVDDELLPHIKSAAAYKHMSIQEYISDILNPAVMRDLDRDPITRRKPPERKPKP